MCAFATLCLIQPYTCIHAHTLCLFDLVTLLHPPSIKHVQLLAIREQGTCFHSSGLVSVLHLTNHFCIAIHVNMQVCSMYVWGKQFACVCMGVNSVWCGYKQCVCEQCVCVCEQCVCGYEQRACVCVNSVCVNSVCEQCACEQCLWM